MDFSWAGLFGAGLVTFVTPCVLPLIPIYLSALIGGDIRELGRGVAGRGALMTRAFAFSGGFLLVFIVLGMTASALGGFLSSNQGALRLLGGILILLFGLKFLGLIHIPLFDRIVRGDDRKLQTRYGLFNAFVMGVVFAAGWSPCVGPVLGSVLTYTASTTSSPLTGAAYLGVYGLGFAVPLLLTALFAEAGVRLLKRINPYLPRIEKAVGALMLIIAASFIFGTGQPAASPGVAGESVAVADTLNCQPEDRLPVMVEFYSADCSICKRMAPLVDGIAGQCHGNKVLVRQIDVSQPENRHYLEAHRLVGVPTFVFFDAEEQEVARLVGEQSESSLRQALSVLRGEPCPGLGALPGTPSADFPVDDAPPVVCGTGAKDAKEPGVACDTPDTPDTP